MGNLGLFRASIMSLITNSLKGLMAIGLGLSLMRCHEGQNGCDIAPIIKDTTLP